LVTDNDEWSSHAPTALLPRDTAPSAQSTQEYLGPEPVCNFIANIKRYVYWEGHVVAQMIEALRYKPEGRGFDSRWCHWNFSLTYSFRAHYGPGVDSDSNRNEYQEYFLGGKGGRCVGLTTLPPSCAVYLEIWESEPPATLRTRNGIALPLHLPLRLLGFENRTVQLIHFTHKKILQYAFFINFQIFETDEIG